MNISIAHYSTNYVPATKLIRQRDTLFAQETVFENANTVANTLLPDEPILCFSPSALLIQARKFLDYFHGETAYAVKANPHPQVIRTLYSNGITTFDVASPQEMALIARHAPGAKIHYHNPVKSRAEIATAYHQYGCKRFAIDHLDELLKITDIIGADENVEIAVRLRLPSTSASVHDFSSKFGATPEEVIILLRKVKALGYQPLVTFHPGSQCVNRKGWLQHINAVASIQHKAGVAISRLNIGGGFPMIYRDKNILPLTSTFEDIHQMVQSSFGDNPPQLECEPGRAIVGSSFSLLTRVKLVRRNLNEIFINDGIYGSLMESTQAPKLTPQHRVLRSSNQLPREFTVFGPTCDPLDVMPLPLELPLDISEGDYIEFLNIGAYGSATSTQFNGYGKTEIVTVANITASSTVQPS